MAKNDDGLIMILDFIEKYWILIFGVFFFLLSFMIFNTVYEKDNKLQLFYKFKNFLIL